MEILALTVGLWLALVVVFAGQAAFIAYRRRQQMKQLPLNPRSGGFVARSLSGESLRGGQFSEVDMLRIQVETLRSQMTTISGGSHGEKARVRRYRSGQYTELPRTLRRQVKRVRNIRHPISV